MEKVISKEQMNYFWEKKEFVSFILSVLVFLIHISSFAQYASTGDLIGLFNEKIAFFFCFMDISFQIVLVLDKQRRAIII